MLIVWHKVPMRWCIWTLCMLSGLPAIVDATVLGKTLHSELLAGEGSSPGLRVGIRWQTETPQLSVLPDDVHMHWEFATTHWQISERDESPWAISISPGLSGQIASWNGTHFFWEFAIGIAVFDDKRFSSKNLGSRYQFEDRLGLRIENSSDRDVSIGIHFTHYSNAGLSSNNPGLDFISISLSVDF